MVVLAAAVLARRLAISTSCTAALAVIEDNTLPCTAALVCRLPNHTACSVALACSAKMFELDAMMLARNPVISVSCVAALLFSPVITALAAAMFARSELI